MKSTVLVVGSLLFFVGVGMTLAALRYRTAECPRFPTLNPKYWKPIWRMQAWFTPRGYKLQLYGWCTAVLGLIIAHLRWYL